MQITILGTESMGVRGLSCMVEIKDRKILIDPGMALGFRRYNLLPHPAQVAVGEQTRKKIKDALKDATDVVISHYHGDHVPLVDANPYQIDAHQFAPLLRKPRFWTKGTGAMSTRMVARRESLVKLLGMELPDAENKMDGALTFSPPMSHGEPNTSLGTMMMTRIMDEEKVFVHGSDIQLLNEQAVSFILDWRPDIVLVGGPPLYLSGFMDRRRQKKSWELAMQLAQGVETLIIDHHLLRGEEGLVWLDHLSSDVSRRVFCGADFMGQPRRLLEAWRIQLYELIPVPESWHKGFVSGDTDTYLYRHFVD